MLWKVHRFVCLCVELFHEIWECWPTFSSLCCVLFSRPEWGRLADGRKYLTALLQSCRAILQTVLEKYWWMPSPCSVRLASFKNRTSLYTFDCTSILVCHVRFNLASDPNMCTRRTSKVHWGKLLAICLFVVFVYLIINLHLWVLWLLFIIYSKFLSSRCTSPVALSRSSLQVAAVFWIPVVRLVVEKSGKAGTCMLSLWCFPFVPPVVSYVLIWNYHKDNLYMKRWL